MMTSSKAVAAGIAAQLVVLAEWGLSELWFWSTMPPAPQAALLGLVVSGISAAVVYFAPANTRKVQDAAAALPAEATFIG
jgi:hypothetical protein